MPNGSPRSRSRVSAPASAASGRGCGIGRGRRKASAQERGCTSPGPPRGCQQDAEAVGILRHRLGRDARIAHRFLDGDDCVLRERVQVTGDLQFGAFDAEQLGQSPGGERGIARGPARRLGTFAHSAEKTLLPAQGGQETDPREHDVASHGSVPGPAFTREKMTAPLQPPNPKELLRACSIAAILASPQTKFSGSSGSGAATLRVGGTFWSRKESTVAIASRAPAAPMTWPMAGLIEETGIRCAAGPKRSRIAAYSMRSFKGVPDPCRLMWSTSCGRMPASPKACPMTLTAPAPLGSGPVM